MEKLPKETFERVHAGLLKLGEAYGLESEQTARTVNNFIVRNEKKEPTGFRPMLTVISALDSLRSKANPPSEYAVDIEFSLLYKSLLNDMESQNGHSAALKYYMTKSDETYKGIREKGESVLVAIRDTETAVAEKVERFDFMRKFVQSLVIVGSVLGGLYVYSMMTEKEAVPQKIEEKPVPLKVFQDDFENMYE